MAHPFTEAIAVFQLKAEEARRIWKAKPDRLTFQAIEERDAVLVFCQEAIDTLHDAYKQVEASENASALLAAFKEGCPLPRFIGDPWNNNPTAH
jgi:hypothetical protein